jgi:hypothetical protein
LMVVVDPLILVSSSSSFASPKSDMPTVSEVTEFSIILLRSYQIGFFRTPQSIFGIDRWTHM